MRVLVIRGLPGSGKSTWVEENFDKDQVVVCSADHFFLKDGEYRFDPTKIGDAHLACQRKFHAELEDWSCDIGVFHDFLIVDNTNIRLWEMAYYIGLSRVFGIEPEVIRIDAHPDVCAARNVHGVPAETIAKMNEEWEHCPPFFARETYVKGK